MNNNSLILSQTLIDIKASKTVINDRLLVGIFERKMYIFEKNSDNLWDLNETINNSEFFDCIEIYQKTIFTSSGYKIHIWQKNNENQWVAHQTIYNIYRHYDNDQIKNIGVMTIDNYLGNTLIAECNTGGASRGDSIVRFWKKDNSDLWVLQENTKLITHTHSNYSLNSMSMYNDTIVTSYIAYGLYGDTKATTDIWTNGGNGGNGSNEEWNVTQKQDFQNIPTVLVNNSTLLFNTQKQIIIWKKQQYGWKKTQDGVSWVFDHHINFNIFNKYDDGCKDVTLDLCSNKWFPETFVCYVVDSAERNDKKYQIKIWQKTKNETSNASNAKWTLQSSINVPELDGKWSLTTLTVNCDTLVTSGFHGSAKVWKILSKEQQAFTTMLALPNNVPKDIRRKIIGDYDAGMGYLKRIQAPFEVQEMGVPEPVDDFNAYRKRERDYDRGEGYDGGEDRADNNGESLEGDEFEETNTRAFTMQKIDNQHGQGKQTGGGKYTATLLHTEKTDFKVKSIAVQDNILVCGGGNGKINIYYKNNDSGEWDLQLNAIGGHQEIVNAVAIHGDTIISGSDDKLIKVWQKEDRSLESKWKFKQNLKGHTNWVMCVAIHEDLIVSGGYDNQIILWRKNSTGDWDLQCIIPGGDDRYTRNLWKTGHTAPILSIAIVGDGSTFITGSIDYTIKIWGRNMTKDENRLQFIEKSGNEWELKDIIGQDETVRSIGFNGSTIVSSCDKTIRIWTIINSKWVPWQNLQCESIVESVVIDSEGKFILGGEQDGLITLWVKNRESGFWELNDSFREKQLGDIINSIVIEDDLIITGSEGKHIDFWRLLNKKTQAFTTMLALPNNVPKDIRRKIIGDYDAGMGYLKRIQAPFDVQQMGEPEPQDVFENDFETSRKRERDYDGEEDHNVNDGETNERPNVIQKIDN